MKELAVLAFGALSAQPESAKRPIYVMTKKTWNERSEPFSSP